MPDFARLLATPGVREHCVIRGRVGFMAFHGGALEEMTDVIAATAAERCDASLYTVIHPDGMTDHLSSIKVRPDESDLLTKFVHHVDIAITIHGFGRRGMFTSLLLGGQNREFAEHVGRALGAALPAYDIRTDLTTIPKSLRGVHPANPVNLPPQRGVQIELPPRVRGSSPLWWDWKGPGLTPHTEALIKGLATAVATWPETG